MYETFNEMTINGCPCKVQEGRVRVRTENIIFWMGAIPIGDKLKPTHMLEVEMLRLVSKHPIDIGDQMEICIETHQGSKYTAIGILASVYDPSSVGAYLTSWNNPTLVFRSFSRERKYDELS